MDMIYLILGIFIGTSYPFVWGLIKGGFTKLVNLVKKDTGSK